MPRIKNYNSIPLLAIEAVAQTLKVHQRTLRIWDQEGILVPTRTEKNRRMYSFMDIEKGKFILFLSRNLAVNLSGIKLILAILEKINIKLAQYIDFTNEIAQKANFDKKVQQENIQKTKKRGRPKKIL